MTTPPFDDLSNEELAKLAGDKLIQMMTFIREEGGYADARDAMMILLATAAYIAIYNTFDDPAAPDPEEALVLNLRRTCAAMRSVVRRAHTH